MGPEAVGHAQQPLERMADRRRQRGELEMGHAEPPVARGRHHRPAQQADADDREQEGEERHVIPLGQRRPHAEDRGGQADQIPERGKDPGTPHPAARRVGDAPGRPVVPPEPRRLGMPRLQRDRLLRAAPTGHHRADAAQPHAAEDQREHGQKAGLLPVAAAEREHHWHRREETGRGERQEEEHRATERDAGRGHARGSGARGGRAHGRVAHGRVAHAVPLETAVSCRPPHSLHDPS